MKTRLWSAAAVACACFTPCAHADTMYVIEQLYVVVNSAADGSGERVAQIKSADSVELIEREGEQAHVRLGSGEEGWVKASYLTADPPLRQQLNARNDELERLRKDKTQLESDLAAAKTAVAAAAAAAKAAKKDASPAAPPPPVAPPTIVAAPVTAAPTVNDSSSVTAESSAQNSPPLFQDEPMMPARPSWLLAIGTALLALGIGFAVGWRMLDRRIRAKYGGLRIY